MCPAWICEAEVQRKGPFSVVTRLFPNQTLQKETETNKELSYVTTTQGTGTDSYQGMPFRNPNIVLETPTDHIPVHGNNACEICKRRQRYVKEINLQVM